MGSRSVGRVCLALWACLVATGFVAAQTKLLRFPDVHGDRVVFSYAGDLWTASTSGGGATRLTAHPGVEWFAKFSPDGEWIAFTGQYDGDEQVYVVSAHGGVPRQLTFFPARGPLPARWGMDNQVYGWTPDSKAVLFRSMRDGWSLTHTRLFTVSREGGLPVALPMPVSGGGTLSLDGKRVAYSPLTRDFRTWKRYEGGWAQDLYLFDIDTGDLEQITRHERTDRDPMWIGETVYFASDRSGTLNLFSWDPRNRRVEQQTDATKWDVRWPSSDGVNQIVYESNGELMLFDTERRRSRSISIRVPDDGLARRPSRISAANRISDFELSPGGERALFVARGDIFTAPVEKGFTRNLTQSSDAHDKWARWSPDGRHVAFVSDATGEDEIYLVAQDGSTPPEALTEGGSAMRYAAEWSPDGRRLAFSDKSGTLYVLEIESRKLTEVARDPGGQLRDYVWSPHGGHLAFSMADPNFFRSIHIWTVADEKLTRVTGEIFSEFGPSWGPNGDYLFYMSGRTYPPQIGNRDWNFVTDRMVSIYGLALREDVEHLLPPESDEVELEDEESKDEGDDEKKSKGKKDKKKKKGDDDEEEKEEEEKKEPIAIDFDGLGTRVVRIPVDADNYTGLSAVDGHLIYVRTGPFYYGRSADVQPSVHRFDLKKREAEPLAEETQGYAVSHDGKKVLVRHASGFKLYDVGGGADGAKPVSTAGLAVDRVPAEEWEQIFDEVWRRFRDFFYVENMHGYDWEALREQYRPWLAHVAHRSDLNYLIGEMIAELNVGHAYIAGGDYDVPDRAAVALPGARFELDAESGRYRVSRILRGHNEEPRYRSPLTEVGVAIEVGDYVLAIDGQELKAPENPYRLLRNKADRPVRFTVNDRPEAEDSREVEFEPLRSETALYYLDMVLTNQERVSELSDGRIGYLHLPNMGADGIREFVKWFYGQVRKEGLVVDVRSNGGGNVSQMVIERLRRELLGTRFARNREIVGTYPAVVFHGHMACLLDEDSASDGDIFPHMFRQAGLGPLIGKRSWGGVVGITNRGTLVDGGTVFVPEFGTNAVDGRWVIEGYGVDPDIEVENDPRALLDGKDPQLERAVAEILKEMRDNPKKLPTRPAPPIKTP